VLGAGGVGTLTDVASLDGGGQHNCVVKTDATVSYWGRNDFKQLGDGSGTDRPYPVQVRGPGGVGFLTGISQVTGANEATCALKTDATVWCWGRNDRGQLGDDTTSDRTCAVLADATMRCWGKNANGQLGDNTTSDRSAPVQVVGARVVSER
jgi:alpha-tubulin suppressor-like RCC1 family protein